MARKKEVHFVGRKFNVDYIYFDCLFLTIWMSALIVLAYRRTKLPLLLGFIGLIVYYAIDLGIWYCITGIRKVTGPIHPALLMLWVSATPGIVHPSWVMLMIQGVYNKTMKKREIFFWTSLFFCVQSIPAFLQTALHLDDRVITISRDMSRGSHGVMIFLFCIGYGFLLFCKIPVTDLLKLFLIGVTVEGFFEYSLWLSGIRSTAFRAVVFDTVFEFNCGIAILFFAWSMSLPKEDRSIEPPKIELPRISLPTRLTSRSEKKVSDLEQQTLPQEELPQVSVEFNNCVAELTPSITVEQAQSVSIEISCTEEAYESSSANASQIHAVEVQSDQTKDCAC